MFAFSPLQKLVNSSDRLLTVRGVMMTSPNHMLRSMPASSTLRMITSVRIDDACGVKSISGTDRASKK